MSTDSIKCPWCGRENRGGANRCSECGTRLVEAPTAEDERPGPSPRLALAIRFLSLVAGALLLFLAIGGVVLWIVSFQTLKMMLLGGLPIILGPGARAPQIPGRLFASLVILIPIFCLFGGFWLLRSALHREVRHDS